MKIGFFGDSYCAEPIRSKDLHSRKYDFSWPYQLRKMLNAEITNQCVSGDTLWHAYLYLEESIEDFDILIICVSDPIRLPNFYRIPTVPPNFETRIAAERLKGVTIKGKGSVDEYEQYVLLHAKYKGAGIEYATQIGVLHKLDELIGKHNKKTIILPCFENSLQGYTFKNASVANINLNEDVKKKVKRPIPLYNDGSKILANHLHVKENEVLAKATFDFINNNDYKLEFNLKKYFEYLEI